MPRFLFKKSMLGLLILAALLPLGSCASSSAENAIVTPDQEAVVLLHGLGRSNQAMWLMASRLEDSGYQVVRVGYPSLNVTPDEVLDNVTRQINACCVGNTPKVHFVGHSLGGLLIRAYLSDNPVPNLGRVVLLGSPNHGTAVVDNLRGKWWFDWMGPMALALGTDEKSFPNALQRPTYPLGVIAGLADKDNDHLLPGEDDGLVSVESTKVDGMKDFVVIETSHAAMRYNKEVARNTIQFLQTGNFRTEAAEVKP